MSKFLTLGYSLEQVVTMATSAPGAPKTGTLQIGAPCDVAIMEVVEGPVSFVDTRNNQSDGKAYVQRRAVRPAVSIAVCGAVEPTGSADRNCKMNDVQPP
jgi:predicted amidohydrolase